MPMEFLSSWRLSPSWQRCGADEEEELQPRGQATVCVGEGMQGRAGQGRAGSYLRLRLRLPRCAVSVSVSVSVCRCAHPHRSGHEWRLACRAMPSCAVLCCAVLRGPPSPAATYTYLLTYYTIKPMQFNSPPLSATVRLIVNCCSRWHTYYLKPLHTVVGRVRVRVRGAAGGR